jgi:NADH-quinone oxidoreductase subunit H
MSASSLVAVVLFPAGVFTLALALGYQWLDRKLVARLQNRVGPRWFQPAADIAKLLVKEEVVPDGNNAYLFIGLPVAALAAAFTAALYVPMAGATPAHSFAGDLIITIYLLSLLTICLGLAGSNTINRFSLLGATRTLTQLFSYEAPFLLALLGPAIAAGTWQISEIAGYAGERFLLLNQPIGFAVAVIGLIGKLELPPFDAPEAETEIVAGALTEYSGRGLGLFRLSKDIELVIGLTLIAAFYLGGVGHPVLFVAKTVGLVLVIAGLQVLFARLRIDQVVGLWWRYGALAALAQLLLLIDWRGVLP